MDESLMKEPTVLRGEDGTSDARTRYSLYLLFDLLAWTCRTYSSMSLCVVDCKPSGERNAAVSNSGSRALRSRAALMMLRSSHNISLMQYD